MSAEASARALRFRAAWLVAAAAGFWLLALGLVALLAVGGWLILTYAPAYALAAFASWGLAGLLAFGLLPRVSFKKDESAPPLAASEHPRFHELVRDVAAKAGARTPDALYVFHDANAFVAMRRPRFLAKRESIVGVGLPLLALLTESEARAVIAHEMGHYVAGDLRLGPWVHRTRRAIAATVDRLEGSSFWLHLPFIAYADFFLRTSVRISRAQEIQADAVAAQVAGASAAASALRKTDVLASAWGAYFQSEVLPLLAKSRLPPLLEGFERYWRAAQTPDTPAYEALSAALEASKKSSAHDTHPTLAERIAALGDPAPKSDYAPPALSLLDDVARAEEKVLRDLLRDPRTKLAPIAWDAIADEVWVPMWREVATANKHALDKWNLQGVPRALEEWDAIAHATRRGPAIASPAAERRRVVRLLATWVTVKLVDRGWRVVAPPGLAVRAEKDGRAIEPFALVDALARAPDAAKWARTCAENEL